MVAKPMIMASLIALYISKVQKQNNLFILALIFALLGDAFLLFTSDEFFMIGLFSFLVMQILYAASFWPDRSKQFAKNLMIATLVIILSSGLIAILWSGLGQMQIVVSVYALAISIMVITAAIRNNKIPAYIWLLIGVILFVVSDALLAYGKFMSALPGQNYLVMGSYMIAQYLIVTAYMEKRIA